MHQQQVCPQGHRWDPLTDRRAEAERWQRCPVCGDSAAAFSARDSTASQTSVAPLPAVPGYEILEEIGRGGMGVIYKARQAATGRIVALKMISAGAQASESDLARFRTETEAVSRLDHPNIVQVVEVGEHAGLPYFALEYMDGGLRN
jgi:serine/threonine protein kinase